MPRALLDRDSPPTRVRPRSHRIRWPRQRPRRSRGGGIAPPGDSGGSGGGGGRGGDGDRWGPDDEDAPPPQPGETPAGTARLGVQLTLGAIAALFFVFLVTLVVLRSTAPEWPPGGARMPAGLWISTALLVLSSAAMQLALRRIQSDSQAAEPAGDLALRLAAAALLGSAFLASQAWIWARLDHAGQPPSSDLYLALFYAATLVHALHVAGGVVLLFSLAVRARRGGASAEGIGLAALYWHFMGVVWLFVFAIVWGPI